MGIGNVQAWLGGVRDNLIVKLLKELNWFAQLCVLMLTANAFAQPPALDLQDSLTTDSLHADSLSKISLALDVDTSNAVDTNKVEHIDAGITKEVFPVNDYFPEGFVVEIAYAAPSALHLSLFGGRDKWNDKTPLKKYDFLYGIPFVSLYIDESMVSDEGILSLFLFICSMGSSEPVMDALLKLDYFLFGNTYFTLSENGRFGLFEKHRILDYAIYSLTTSGKSWEFGFSEAVGLRFVLLKNRRRSGYYIDLGVHVRITNQRFRYGVFVQLGGFGSSK